MSRPRKHQFVEVERDFIGSPRVDLKMYDDLAEAVLEAKSKSRGIFVEHDDRFAPLNYRNMLRYAVENRTGYRASVRRCATRRGWIVLLRDEPVPSQARRSCRATAPAA